MRYLFHVKHGRVAAEVKVIRPIYKELSRGVNPVVHSEQLDVIAQRCA